MTNETDDQGSHPIDEIRSLTLDAIISLNSILTRLDQVGENPPISVQAAVRQSILTDWRTVNGLISSAAPALRKWQRLIESK